MVDLKQTQSDALKIVVIGSGNVATLLGCRLKAMGHHMVQVYSPTAAHAHQLATKLQAEVAENLSSVVSDADIYLIAVKDDAIPAVAQQLSHVGGVVVHTAGSVDVDILKPYCPRRGVLYPLQTISKDKELDFSVIPLFVEANTTADEAMLMGVASQLSTDVHRANSAARKAVHLSAVYACNFVNHLYALAYDVLEQHQLPFDVLKPLIAETSQKVMTMLPHDAQTGPAVRNDKSVMNSHLQMISDASQRQLYQLLSQSIMRRYQQPEMPDDVPFGAIKSFVFDVDGVLSGKSAILQNDGDLLRTANAADSYAIQYAIKMGYDVAIITGGRSEAVKAFYESQGIRHIYLRSGNKIERFHHYLAQTGLDASQILYIGDDLPDYEVMSRVGMAVAPADAALEIKELAHYVCPMKGGEGVARHIIEKVLKTHGKWLSQYAFEW